MSKKTREQIVAAVVDGKPLIATKGNLQFTINYKKGTYSVKTLNGEPMTEQEANNIKFVSSLLKMYAPNVPGGSA